MHAGTKIAVDTCITYDTTCGYSCSSHKAKIVMHVYKQQSAFTTAVVCFILVHTIHTERTHACSPNSLHPPPPPPPLSSLLDSLLFCCDACMLYITTGRRRAGRPLDGNPRKVRRDQALRCGHDRVQGAHRACIRRGRSPGWFSFSPVFLRFYACDGGGGRARRHIHRARARGRRRWGEGGDEYFFYAVPAPSLHERTHVAIKT